MGEAQVLLRVCYSLREYDNGFVSQSQLSQKSSGRTKMRRLLSDPLGFVQFFADHGQDGVAQKGTPRLRST